MVDVYQLLGIEKANTAAYHPKPLGMYAILRTNVNHIMQKLHAAEFFMVQRLQGSLPVTGKPCHFLDN